MPPFNVNVYVRPSSEACQELAIPGCSLLVSLRDTSVSYTLPSSACSTAVPCSVRMSSDFGALPSMPTVTDESETSVPKDVMGFLRPVSDSPSHSSTLSTIATPKKISQRVASAFRLRFRPFSSMHPSLVDACYTPDGRVRFDGVPARRLACVGITRRTRPDTCR